MAKQWFCKPHMRVRSLQAAFRNKKSFVFYFSEVLMPRIKENLVKLECTDCHRINYYTRKNKKRVKTRLELKKFCKHCRKHTLHKETK